MAEPGPIANLSDTARWVAVYRAMESERPDAIFHDPYARRLAGAQGEAIVKHMPGGARTAWPMIVRTAVMDEIIARAIAKSGVVAVLNLAAGLDTRPYRLDLPARVHWFDADLPDILDYKVQQLEGETPRCAYEAVKVDLTDATAREALFDRVARVGPTLVIAEGLLVYLDPEAVLHLARALHARDTFHWWLMDIAAPKLVKMLERRWGSRLRAGGAPFRFFPEESTAFFEPAGWREVEFRSVFEEAHRLKRTMRLAWLWRCLGRFSSERKRREFFRMSGIVLLGRQE